MSLKMAQLGGVRTVSLFVRSLLLKTVDRSQFEAEGKPEPEDIQKARNEIRELLERLGVRRGFVKLRLEESDYTVSCDEQGLDVMARKFLTVTKKQSDENMVINECVSLIENFPMGELHKEEDEDEGLVKRMEQCVRERTVKLARQEIQGVFEAFGKLPYFSDLRTLERACTGILEPVLEKDVDCEYCDVRHRNGDCKVPMNL